MNWTMHMNRRGSPDIMSWTTFDDAMRSVGERLRDGDRVLALTGPDGERFDEDAIILMASGRANDARLRQEATSEQDEFIVAWTGWTQKEPKRQTCQGGLSAAMSLAFARLDDPEVRNVWIENSGEVVKDDAAIRTARKASNA